MEFGKSYLDEDKKINLTIKALRENKLDILFLVEATNTAIMELAKRLGGYRIVENTMKKEGGSIILIREKSFPQLKTSLKNANFELLNAIYSKIEE